MALVSELLFAQRFPFSSAAKRVLRENNLSLEELPEEVVSRASAMVLNAAKNKPYVLKEISKSSDLLLQEILAFPIAKIFVSLQKEAFLNEKFAFMFSKAFLEYIDLEKNKKETALEIAKDLGLEFEFGTGFFVSVPLVDFLKIPFKNPSLKLVNQQVSGGKVLLLEQAFFVFVSEIVFSAIFNSLPVPLEGIPIQLKNSAKQLQQQLLVSQKRDFEFKFSGKINPNIFPECTKAMYNSVLQGKNLQHSGRFYLAAFLNAIGMPQEQIIQAFAKTPNFSEKMTRYQVQRIIANKLSPPSCAKIKEAGLCHEDCGNRHPLSYYKKQLETSKKAFSKKAL